MSIEETEQEIIKEFQSFTDWMDRYEHIVKIGKSYPNMHPDDKNDYSLIKGCQSKVWLTSYKSIVGKMIYAADSDALITKGLICLLIRVLTNRPPIEIINAKLDFIKKIGLTQHLTPSRNNGLLSMIKQMKKQAMDFN